MVNVVHSKQASLLPWRFVKSSQDGLMATMARSIAKTLLKVPHRVLILRKALLCPAEDCLHYKLPLELDIPCLTFDRQHSKVACIPVLSSEQDRSRRKAQACESGEPTIKQRPGCPRDVSLDSNFLCDDGT